MNFRIISIPPFEAIISAVDKEFDFSEEGILGKFDTYFSKIRLSARDSFMPRDFLYFDTKQEGMVWMYAITDQSQIGNYETINFEGGLYVTYTYKDGDNETNSKLYSQAIEYISNHEFLELDIRENHYSMGHIITPQELIKVQNWAQMETFIPVRVK